MHGEEERKLPDRLKGVNSPSFPYQNIAWSPVLRGFDDAPGVYQLAGLAREDYRPCESRLFLVGNRLASIMGARLDSDEIALANLFLPHTRINYVADATTNSWEAFRKNRCAWKTSPNPIFNTIHNLAENERLDAFWLSNEMAFIDGILYTNSRNAGGPNSICDPWGKEIATGSTLAAFAAGALDRKTYGALEAERLDAEQRERRERIITDATEARARNEIKLAAIAAAEASAVKAVKHDRELEVFGIF